jgi:SAM-dependent methyltransferase
VTDVDTSTQFRHSMLPEFTSEEASRQEFVKSLKLHLAHKVAPGNKIAYESNVLPRYEKAHGRAPKDRHEVRKEMSIEPTYRMWSTLLRISQEMMWHACQVPVERQLDDLVATAKQVAKEPSSTGGALELDPDLKIPAYHTTVDIHCQPGAYHTEVTTDDVAAGAVYDRAVYIYAMGRMGPFNNDIGASLAEWLMRERPGLKPQRILDLGCSVGHSTIPYVDLYPDAEVYAIDVGAPMLRYAHARAESLGKKIHFSQQNAEDLNFDDNFFDLIVSHILVHETSNTAIRRIMKECHRVIAPGGLVVHAETPPYRDMQPFDAFILDWDTRNNNEPFWGGSHEIDPVTLAEQAGFPSGGVFETMAPSAFADAEARRTHAFRGGDFGGGGVWYCFGVQKAQAKQEAAE